MNKKRQEVEKFIKDWIYKITKSKKNVKLYEDMFKSMNDKEFDKFMHNLKDGKILEVIIPLDKFDGKVELETNLKLAKELGFDFFQHLTIGPSEDFPKYKTTEKFLVYDLPYRRTKQTLEKGLSVAKDSKKIDILTGQVKGDSASSKMSYPELQVLLGIGVKKSLVEIMRDRGGDTHAMQILQTALSKYGTVSQELVGLYSNGVLSTRSLKNYLNGMHLKNTL